MRARLAIRFAIAIALGSASAPLVAEAQTSNGKCFFLCQPELKIEPTITVENLFRRHKVAESDENGEVVVSRAHRETVFETVVALDIPTEIPRIGFTFEAIFAPFLKDNSPETELELNFKWLRSENTRGWVGSHFDIIDQFSPVERPGNASSYTHKLNFELDTAVSILKWLPRRNWLSGIEVEGSLDYLATGLPRKGNRIGNTLFLDNASRWSFSLVFVLPIAPLSR